MVRCCTPAMEVSKALHRLLARATRCDATHLRWGTGGTCDHLQWSAMLLEPQNRRKMAHFIAVCGRGHSCDAFSNIVGIFAPDFRISQLFIIRFSNGLQYCDRGSIPFHVVCDKRLSLRYFELPSQRWSSQENIKTRVETYHREKQTGHTAAIFLEKLAMICDGLRCF